MNNTATTTAAAAKHTGHWDGHYYRTGKGQHRHASVHCADVVRTVFTGDPVRIPADELANWAPCSFCCTDADVAAAQAAEDAKAAAQCPNTGVTNMRRLYSTCRDCGKEGKVTNIGTLRAHRPA